MSHSRYLDTSLTGSDLREFSFNLMNKPMFLPDILRDVKRVMEVASATFDVSCQPYALVDNSGKLGGVFYISDVVPEHEGVLYCWVWNRGVITPTTLRFVKEYIDSVAEEFILCRVVARTPDKKLCRLLRALGLKEEGRFKLGYRSGGRSHTLFQMRKLYGRRIG